MEDDVINQEQEIDREDDGPEGEHLRGDGGKHDAEDKMQQIKSEGCVRNRRLIELEDYFDEVNKDDDIRTEERHREEDIAIDVQIGVMENFVITAGNDLAAVDGVAD